MLRDTFSWPPLCFDGYAASPDILICLSVWNKIILFIISFVEKSTFKKTTYYRNKILSKYTSVQTECNVFEHLIACLNENGL